MGTTILGLVIDSSVFIALERRGFSVAQAIEDIRKTVDEIPLALSAVTIAEIGHGIYRAPSDGIRARRRKFLDDLEATMPIHPLTEAAAEIAARVSGEQASRRLCP